MSSKQGTPSAKGKNPVKVVAVASQPKNVVQSASVVKKTPTTPTASVSMALNFAGLLNPHVFSMTRTVLKRDSRSNPLGLEVKQAAPDVLQVTNVIQGQAAAKTTIKAGMYLLAFDGKQVKTVAQFKELEKSSRRTFCVAAVKLRPIAYRPGAFPIPDEIRPAVANHSCLLFRLNPTDGVHMGTGIGEKDGSVYITQIFQNSAGEKAGLKLNDRVLMVDGTPVKSQKQCGELVKASGGNPMDMVVDRLVIPVPKPSPNAAATSKLTIPAKIKTPSSKSGRETETEEETEETEQSQQSEQSASATESEKSESVAAKPKKVKKKRRKLTKEQVAVFTEVFREFDRNGSGDITSKELCLALKSLGMALTEGTITELIQEVDTDGNGSVDLDEFLDLMERKMLECKERGTDESARVRELFKRFDVDKDGYISPAELNLMMTNLGEKMSKSEIAAMITAADADGDGRVGIEDFVKMLKRFGKKS